MLMLTPYVLTEFHDFSVYFILGTCNAIWNFSRDQRVNSIKYKKESVTTDVHWPGGTQETKPQPSGPRMVPI
jgi:hypothetical protein